jgi:hypothetical protein
MKTPVLLLGAALMFWGWQTGHWIWAAPMAFTLEGSRLIRFRWDLADAEFSRISDLCTILFLMLLIYLFTADRSVRFIVGLIQWLPVVLFPLLAAQAYATRDRIDIRVLFLLKRRKKDIESPGRSRIHLSYPYFAVCILSASAANVRNSAFYLTVFVLFCLALWTVRSKRFSPVLWICLLAMAGGGGLLGHVGLHRLQLFLEQKGLEWTSDFRRQGSDPFRTHTSIGEIGSLKPSSRILFRVKPDGQKLGPMLLRETAYNRYLSSLWVAVDPGFVALQPAANATTWNLRKGLPDSRAITVSAYHHKGKSVLKLPGGAFKVNQLPVKTVQMNRYGTVKVEGGPDLATYQVLFDERVVDESPPTGHDLNIPDNEKSALYGILDQLQLTGKPPREILMRVETFFRKNFQYSLVLTGKNKKKTPLANFLMQSRSGHCEYFATATVLLLRAAGIPTRYAKGYSMHEFSKLERLFIVRDRHAHAWTRVNIDGVWHNFDTTPGSWVAIENAAVPGWQIFSDLGSWCRFNLSQAFGWVRQSGRLRHLVWLVIPIILFAVRRLFQRKGVRRIDTQAPADGPDFPTPTGKDSEFYLIEKALVRAGFVRQPAKTLRAWIEQLPQETLAAPLMDDLKILLDLHYRYRFDPGGIGDVEKAQLTTATRLWLKNFDTQK